MEDRLRTSKLVQKRSLRSSRSECSENRIAGSHVLIGEGTGLQHGHDASRGGAEDHVDAVGVAQWVGGILCAHPSVTAPCYEGSLGSLKLTVGNVVGRGLCAVRQLPEGAGRFGEGGRTTQDGAGDAVSSSCVIDHWSNARSDRSRDRGRSCSGHDAGPSHRVYHGSNALRNGCRAGGTNKLPGHGVVDHRGNASSHSNWGSWGDASSNGGVPDLPVLVSSHL